MALSYRIFSLVHLLVDYAFSAAIRVAYDDGLIIVEIEFDNLVTMRSSI